MILPTIFFCLFKSTKRIRCIYSDTATIMLRYIILQSRNTDKMLSTYRMDVMLLQQSQRTLAKSVLDALNYLANHKEERHISCSPVSSNCSQNILLFHADQLDEDKLCAQAV